MYESGEKVSGYLREVSAAASTLLTDLVAYWALEETSGTRVSTVGSFNMTEDGTTGRLAGKHNFGADLSLVGRLLRVGGNIFGDTDFTIALWARHPSGGGHGSVYIFDHWDSDAGNTEDIDIEYASTGPIAYIRDWNDQVTSTVPFTDDVWHLIIVWHDSVNNKLGISADNETAVETSTGGPNSTVTGNLYFNEDGKNDGGAGANQIQEDEVMVWSRVLSSAERAELWNGGAGKFYPFA